MKAYKVKQPKKLPKFGFEYDVHTKEYQIDFKNMFSLTTNDGYLLLFVFSMKEWVVETMYADDLLELYELIKNILKEGIIEEVEV